jgi:lipid II:glycine glycyltransferase (peptidoglycan interpeptide bridge formation enzyme)
MRRQTRYEIRQALKQDLQVDYATDQAAFEQFYRVQQQTAARQHFLAPSLRELLAIHEAFGEDARIYRAYAPGSNRTPGGQQPLAYGLVVISGREADYLEAASEPAARGVPTAYALQWRIIRDLKSAGIERYNLWGIAYSSDPRHRYAQVTTFKNGFGGNKVTYVSAHDLVIKPPRYAPVWVLETLRRRLRRL